MKFYAVADTGSFPPELEDLIDLIKIDAEGDNRKTEFLTIVGDNFYFDGISFIEEDKEEQWQDYEKMFKPLNMKIYPVLGNHDYMGDIWAQTEYKGWEFPYLYYFRKIGNAGFWFLDSQILAPECPGDYSEYQVMTGHIEKKVLPVTGSKDWREERMKQIKWLTGSLEENDDLKYKFFFGHYPIISMGVYDQRHMLGDIILPLMKKYNVSGYISGHDHNAQHVVINYNGFQANQFVVGATMDNSPYEKMGDSYHIYESRYFSNEPSFLRVENSRGEMFLEFVNKDGLILYSVNLEYVDS